MKLLDDWINFKCKESLSKNIKNETWMSEWVRESNNNNNNKKEWWKNISIIERFENSLPIRQAKSYITWASERRLE